MHPHPPNRPVLRRQLPHPNPLRQRPPHRDATPTVGRPKFHAPPCPCVRCSTRHPTPLTGSCSLCCAAPPPACHAPLSALPYPSDARSMRRPAPPMAGCSLCLSASPSSASKRTMNVLPWFISYAIIFHPNVNTTA